MYVLDPFHFFVNFVNLLILIVCLAVKSIKDRIRAGAIVNSELPEKFRQKAAAKSQQDSEMRNIMSFISSSISQEALAAASQQARSLGEAAAIASAAAQQQKIKENKERREAEREMLQRDKDILHPRDSKGAYIVRPKKEKPPEPEKEKKPIVKKRIEKTEEGFMTEVTEVCHFFVLFLVCFSYDNVD